MVVYYFKLEGNWLLRFATSTLCGCFLWRNRTILFSDVGGHTFLLRSEVSEGHQEGRFNLG